MQCLRLLKRGGGFLISYLDFEILFMKIYTETKIEEKLLKLEERKFFTNHIQ